MIKVSTAELINIYRQWKELGQSGITEVDLRREYAIRVIEQELIRRGVSPPCKTGGA